MEKIKAGNYIKSTQDFFDDDEIYYFKIGEYYLIKDVHPPTPVFKPTIVEIQTESRLVALNFELSRVSHYFDIDNILTRKEYSELKTIIIGEE